MNKFFTSIVLAATISIVLASTALASSAIFHSASVDTIENNINALTDKVAAFSKNEEKIVEKYMVLYEEYTKLKEAPKQTPDTESKNDLESEINRLKKELEKQEQENKKQKEHITELEAKIKSLESVQVNQEQLPQDSTEAEVE